MQQKHPAMPTSNSPPTWEWGPPAWYTLFSDVMQASPTLTPAEAEELVGALRARRLTLPCPECRANYARRWEARPFTTAHALNPTAALEWAVALKTEVDAEVAAEKAAAAAATAAATAVRARRPPALVQRTPTTAQIRAAVARLPAARLPLTLAARAALQRSAANRAGVTSACVGCARGRR